MQALGQQAAGLLQDAATILGVTLDQRPLVRIELAPS